MRGFAARRNVTTAAAVVTVPAVIAVLALLNPGFPLARVELNDGAVWLTATDLSKLGRYNVQVDELNAGLVAESMTFDVLQDEGDVVLVEPGKVSVVDPATVALTTQVAAAGVQPSIVPGGAVSMSAGVLSLVDGEGGLYVRPLSSLDSMRPGEGEPDVDLGRGGRAVVSTAGVAYGVAADGTVSRVTAVGEGARVQEDGSLGEGELDQLTAVGDEPVGLRGSTVVTRHGSVEVSGTNPTLQQPGPASSRVLVATDTDLVEVPLDGGDPVAHPTDGSGKPAAPVQVGTCAHGAWASATGSYQQLCDGKAPVVQALEDMSAQDELVFRVNRSAVVLNDAARGRVWEPQEDTELRVPNWEDIKEEENPDDDVEDSESEISTQDLATECSAESSPPTAKDDEFGVRPGRTTILSVLSNDSSSDCGILAVREFESIASTFGTVEAIHGGRALQVDIAPGASGSQSFTYTIDDGRGTSAPSTATVTLVVHDDGENSPPVQDRQGSFEVEQNGQATYDVLANFHDPDGDDLVLVGASTDPAIGTVRFRQDGTVTFRADGGKLGRATVDVLVSDGSSDDPTPGTVQVDVRSAGSLPPQVDPVHAVTYVDKPVTLEPLEAVRSTGEEPARLASVEEVTGATISADLQAGTFTFAAPRPGSYYVKFVVAAPPQQATGLARIDVRAWPEEAAPPIAVRDRAFLPAGGEVTIDPLANDSDPAGEMLVLQSVDTSGADGLSVAILEHHLVQIRSERTLDHVVVLPYTITNGTKSATGQIVVQPVPPASSTQPPVVENVEATVRTGGVVTIPVLDSAYDPDGDALTLEPKLVEEVAPGDGLMFVSGDVLRYQAPANPVTARATFEISDSTGARTAATVTVRVHESDPSTKSPPRPRDLEARVFAGETVRIKVPLIGIDPDGDGVTLLGQASGAVKGRVDKVGPDWIEYYAYPTESGTETFQYAVEDWVGQRAVASIRVGISPRPGDTAAVVARDDAVTIKPGERIEVRVLANDVDNSGDELSLDPVLEMDEGVQAEVVGRRIAVTAPTSAAVIPIVYRVTNSRGGQDFATLTVTVDPDAPVLPPIAEDVVVPATETFGLTEVVVDVLATAQNPSGPLSDLEVRVPDSIAQVATVTPDGKVLVTLTDQTQTLPFQLVNRRAPETATAYAFITVPALGFIRPSLRPGAPELRVASGEELTIVLEEQIKVAQGRQPSVADALQVTATRGTVSISSDGREVTFTPAAEYAGPASVTMPVTDATSANDTSARTSFLTLPIEVFAVDDHPPTFVPATIEVGPGEPVTQVDLRAFTLTPEGATPTEKQYSYAVASSVPAGFTATIDGSVLSVGADVTTDKGTRGLLQLRIGFGRKGQLDTQLDLRVIASTRPKAHVQDWTVDDAVEGEPRTIDVLDGSFNPYPQKDLRVVGATVQSGRGTAAVSGARVTVTPAPDYIGELVVRYRVRDAIDEADREVEGRISLNVRGVPDAPSQPKIGEERDRTVVLSWVAPNSRGAAITGYRVTARPGGLTQTCASTTCTFDGLTNDVTYTFTVAAQNAVGWSQESAASAQARPDAVPEAPARVDFVGFGDGTLSWSWPDAVTHGSKIVNYEVQITPAPPSGSAVLKPTAPKVTFTDLANGTAYSIRVRAVNALQDRPSPWTPWTGTEWPAAPPSAPTGLQAVRTDTALGGQIDVSWSAPATNNGDSVQSYRLVVRGGGEDRTIETEQRSHAFKAQNGTEYTFAVQARNKAGWGPTSDTVTARAFGAPRTPSLAEPVAPAGSGTVRLSWDRVDDRGSRVTYDVYDGDSVVGSTEGTSFEHSGLTGGSSHTYRVKARNEGGSSDFSNSRSATPTTPPGQPSGLRMQKTGEGAGGRPTQITVSWDAVPDGGGKNLQYEWKLEMRGRDASGGPITGTSATVDVSDWNINYSGSDLTLSVRASTDIATTSWSSATVNFSWGAAPSEPTSVQLALDPATAPTRVTATWAPPTKDGGLDITYEFCWYLDGRRQDSTCRSGFTDRASSFSGFEVRDRDQEVELRIRAHNDRGDSSEVRERITIPAYVEPDPPPDE
ncbi:Ig-like domain-containing protein [Cellulomonas persica]|uniref:ATPase AAA n=1 Tax=Cellulomonas persica TaxID=76861 RepID=A0A510UWC9_9CELL|nr:Ig-like domain-containing protein [Cellulomonas persica]GEK17811.1 ATPase AAA [Cellulomonas persica]